MSVVRRISLTLAAGSLFLLSTPRTISLSSTRATSSTAHAQERVAGRIDFYLPPQRPKAPARIAAPRPLTVVPARAEAPQWKWPALTRERKRVGQSRFKPGLFTVHRIGRRLLYRKGYLGDVPIHAVIADLNDPQIKIGIMVARGGIGTRESFASMIHRAQPSAALTGTFFGLRNGLPTGDLVVNGRAIYQGFIGTALAFTEGNTVAFIPTGYKEKPTWRLFDGVMRGGPLLIREGRIAVGPREEGFISLSAAARRQRTAVGITRGRKLVLMAVKAPVSLWRLAKLMRALGAYHAVAMDGGTSTGLYVRGQMIARPGRALTNALVIYAYPKQYEQAKTTFLPHHRPRSTVPAAPEPPLRVEIEPAPEASPPPALPLEPAATADTSDPAASVLPSLPAEPAAETEPATAPASPPSTPGANEPAGS